MARQSNDPRELVVAPDGSGTHKTIQEAIAAAPTGTRSQPTTIRVRPGTYREVLYVQREKRFLRLLGEDPAKTIVVYGLYAALTGLDGMPIGTFRTATATFDGDDITVENLSFINDAGPKGQALAVRVDGDRIVFRSCHFTGWQDTLFDNRGRHFYQGCTITGATDFIFGGGTGFFEDCKIVCVGDGYITAASTPEEQAAGFVFSKCEVMAANKNTRTYLGRPWRDFSQTTWLECDLGSVVRPEGWSNWNNREKTVRYSEYRCFGAGAGTKNRVPWAKKLTRDEATPFLFPERVLSGADRWHPRAGLYGGARHTPDTVYRTVAGERLMLDLSVPESGTGPFPIVLCVHGGGWGSGDKQGDFAPLLGPHLEGRCVWATLNYRLAPKHRWPACQDDLLVAIHWLREHAREWNADPEKLFLVGYSAGGQLACRVALMPEQRIAGVVGLAAPTDLLADTERRGGLGVGLRDLLGTKNEKPGRGELQKLREMSALFAVNPGAPPCLLVHGTEDKSVLYSQSVNFAARLGGRATLLTLTGAPHAIAEWQPFLPDWAIQVAAWLLKRTA